MIMVVGMLVLCVITGGAAKGIASSLAGKSIGKSGRAEPLKDHVNRSLCRQNECARIDPRKTPPQRLFHLWLREIRLGQHDPVRRRNLTHGL